MRKPLLYFLILLCSPSAHFRLKAQTIFSDDFSGSSVISQNAWQGDISEFQINTQQLQLFAPTGGTSQLTLPYQATDSLQFTAWLRLDFAPSATNLLQVWIMAGSSDLTTADGYYLEIGENGTNDAIHFKKRVGGTSTIIASAQSGAVANQPALVRLQLTALPPGKWTLSTNYTGGTSLNTEWTTTDTQLSLTGTKHAGIFCLYTDTRKDKFFFDDISLIRLQPDTAPPTGLSAEILNSTQVKFNLNEPVLLTGTIRCDVFPPFQTTPNIALVPGQNAVIGTFNTPLTSGTNYTFRLLSVSDLSGNIADTLEFMSSFIQYEQASAGDIIINEIFPDPSPSIGLPPDEFVEIWNRSTKYIKGEDLRWKDGTSAPVTLTGVTLAPGQIQVLCAVNAVQNFPQGIQITGISPFPTLNNDGETLTLLNTAGEVIDEISFELSWYKDSNKDDGGWSLERINPTLPCSDGSNWAASTHPLGGTPGVPNSILVTTPDTDAPRLLSAQMISNQEIKVKTSEPLDANSATDPDQWQVSPATLQILQISQGSKKDEWIIRFDTEIPQQVLFTLTALSVADCSGNAAQGPGARVTFARTVAPQPQQVVINEILFNPQTGGSRFVEIYNQSNQFISLAGCRLVGGKSGSPTLHSLSANFDLYPDSLLAFSPNVSDILTRYNPPSPHLVLNNSLPTLPDNEGILKLECPAGGGVQVIDSVSYTKDWHSPFLNSSNLEGVSLERIGKGLDSNRGQSWASSAHSTGATPGYRNTQYYAVPPQGNADQFLTLTQDRISPDGDGFEDYLPIVFRAEKPGYSGTVQIFDSEGVLVNRLESGALLGSETIFRWDGDNASGEIQRPGIYLLFFEFVSPEGQRHRGKRIVTLLAKF